MGAKNEMTITFDSRSCNEGFVRVAVAAFCTQLNPTLEEVADIKTAVSEAITNLIIHGYDGEVKKIRVDCYTRERTIYVTVTDEGKGIEDVAKAMEPLFTTRPELDRSGMGFAFMEAFMDEVQVESQVGKGTVVRMKKTIGNRPGVICVKGGHMGDTLALLKMAHEGDKHARDTLIEENIGLVWSIVRRFQNRGVEMEDLFQIGSIGLIKAVDKFNTEYEVQFSTYAVPMIAGEIKRFLRDDGILKVSRLLKENAGKAYHIREKMGKEKGRGTDHGGNRPGIGNAGGGTGAGFGGGNPGGIFAAGYLSGGGRRYLSDGTGGKRECE